MFLILKVLNTDDIMIYLKGDKKFHKVNQITDQDISINTPIMDSNILIQPTEVETEKKNESVSVEYTNFSNETSTLEYNNYVETLLSSNEITKQGIHLEWVVAKIRQEIEEWQMIKKVQEKRGQLQKITEKSILLFMGLLDINMGIDALKGGPVGELVQWSDLIAALNMLRHQIEIVMNGAQFEQKMVEGRHYDLIITDYLGLFRISEERYFQNLCKFRILDIFGTDPQFNIRTYTMLEKGLYDKWNLPDMRQIWTYYPLNQDNSFLGINIPSRLLQKQTNTNFIDKKKIALVYGKVASYLNYSPNNINVLKLISDYMQIHLTMSPDQEIENLPFEKINHGVLSQSELAELLDQTHLFVGLGLPFIGPGPLDALAHGCTFLQPSFEIPKNRDTDALFQGKPTMLTLNSQHSYLEKFGDPDYVYTIDYNNIELVKQVVEQIAQRPKLPPYIPHEFTGVGFVDRLAILTEKLNTCNSGNVALGKVPILGDVNSLDNTDSINRVTDGVWSMDSCYILAKQDLNKSCINIVFENTIWVWEIKLRLLPTWNKVGYNPSAHIDIELLSENGQLLKVRRFVVDRVSIEWLWVDTGSVANVRLYSDVSINICELEVYSHEAYQKTWPSIDMLKVKYSKPGESCSTTCFTHELICARNLFPMLDSVGYLQQHFECSNYRTDMVGPAMDDSQSSEILCILNTDSMLYSCVAYQDSVIRLCPCVLKHPGQNGVPLADAFN